MARISGKAVFAAGSASTPSNNNSPFVANLIYMNDGIRVCSAACSCCWDKPNPETYEDKVVYLGKRAKTGHTSVLEHSNLVMLVKFPEFKTNSEAFKEALDAIACGRYLNFATAEKDNTTYVLIGGSWRGYDDLFKTVKDPDENGFMRAISKVLYENVNSAIFTDLISEGILKDYNFTNIEPDSSSIYFNKCPDTPAYSSDKIDLVSFDNINQIAYNIKSIAGETLFDTDTLAKMTTLTILFKDMSRTGTHQLVRHRNAITQESQRYVDYSNAAFADPTSFKPDKYDPKKVYTVGFGGETFEFTSMELGEAIIGIYEDMRAQGMLKEDARSFLPGNVKCRRLYMTFTLDHFLKFLELRCAPAAQAEIRSFALDCRNAFENTINIDMDNVKKLAVDEIISDKEVILKNIVDNSDELK